jgi:RecA/RadA recombinase
MIVQAKIPTGCDRLDRFLSGGISNGNVTLFYGEPETGKTTMALQCAVNCSRRGFKTLYVDCDGSFSAQRLSQIALEDFERAAELIILMKPASFREQGTVVDQLSDLVSKNFGLVVFDTLTSLYRLNVAETPNKTFDLNRELNRQTASLAQVARTQKIALIMASQVHSVLNEPYVSVQPVATRVLKFWADSIISMQPTGNPQMLRLIVEKVPDNPKVDKPATFPVKMDEHGIHDYIER